MSKPNLKVPNVAADADDDYYFEAYHPDWATVSFDAVQRDVICSKCGLWKSEHTFEACAIVNFAT